VASPRRPYFCFFGGSVWRNAEPAALVESFATRPSLSVLDVALAALREAVLSALAQLRERHRQLHHNVALRAIFPLRSGSENDHQLYYGDNLAVLREYVGSSRELSIYPVATRPNVEGLIGTENERNTLSL